MSQVNFAVYYVSKNIVTALGSKDEGYKTQFKKSVILKNALPQPGNIYIKKSKFPL
jgi:hypothetical protein